MYDAVDKPFASRGGRAATGGGKLGLPAYLAIAYLVPCLIFAVVYCLASSMVHYTEKSLVQAIDVLMLIVALALFVPAFSAVRSRGETGDPGWYIFAFTTSILAWVLGNSFGNWNYRENIVPYMDIQQLNAYPSVNPATSRGEGLMDAGRLTFVPGAAPDLSKSMGFRDLDIYCVAPVTMSANQTLSTYDFWAVGINCCSGHGPDFACGEIANSNAHSGLRLMREDQRGYFRLAVQQAEASFNIHANHPIFLYWMQDPLVELNSYQADASAYLSIGLVCFCAAQLVAVVLAVLLFSQKSSLF